MKDYQKIIDKLVSESIGEANALVADAKSRATVLVAEAKSEAKALKKSAEESAAFSRVETVKRRLTVADLDVKKLMLAAKKEVLDEVFSSAKASLKTLPSAEYKKLISAMIKSVAEDGDEVVVGKNDKGTINSDFVKSISKKMGIKITLSKDEGNFDGGIVLRGQNADKNMTFDTEILAIREDIESELGKEIFKD